MQNTKTKTKAYLARCRQQFLPFLIELVKSERKKNKQLEKKNKELEEKLLLVAEENERLLKGYSTIMAQNILIESKTNKLAIENEKLKNEINIYLQ